MNKITQNYSWGLSGICKLIQTRSSSEWVENQTLFPNEMKLETSLDSKLADIHIKSSLLCIQSYRRFPLSFPNSSGNWESEKKRKKNWQGTTATLFCPELPGNGVKTWCHHWIFWGLGNISQKLFWKDLFYLFLMTSGSKSTLHLNLFLLCKEEKSDCSDHEEKTCIFPQWTQCPFVISALVTSCSL